MKVRILKTISIFLVTVMFYTFSGTAFAYGWYGNYGYYYDRYYNYNHHGWNSRDTWGLIGIGILGLVIANSQKSSKTYSEKKGNAISKFNQLENGIYRLINSDRKGEIGLFSYSSEEELKAIKKVFKAVYGEYFLINITPYNGTYVAVYLKFTKTFESKKVTGMEYEDFVAIQLVNNLPRNMRHYIEYNKKLFTSLNKLGANCYRDGDTIILQK